jgi:DNA repair ATPase RecN
MSDEILKLIEEKTNNSNKFIETSSVVFAHQQNFAATIAEIINAAIKEANNTESIDERIAVLVKALSDVNTSIQEDLRTLSNAVTKYSIETQILKELSEDFKKKIRTPEAPAEEKQEKTKD